MTATTADPVTEPGYDEIAVSQVVEDGHRMKLRGRDRSEAIRRMAASGRFTQQEAADALMLRLNTLSVYASRLRVSFPSAIEPMHWSVPYMTPSAGRKHGPSRHRKIT